MLKKSVIFKRNDNQYLKGKWFWNKYSGKLFCWKKTIQIEFSVSGMKNKRI